MPAFVKIRAELSTDQDLARRLAEIEKTLIGHDTACRTAADASQSQNGS